MATRELHNLVRCNINAGGLQVQEEKQRSPLTIVDTLSHEWLGVEPTTCPTEKQWLSNETTALVCEAGSARNRAAGSFSGKAAALTRHRHRSVGVCRPRPLGPKRWPQRVPSARIKDSQPLNGSHTTRTLVQKYSIHASATVIAVPDM